MYPLSFFFFLTNFKDLNYSIYVIEQNGPESEEPFNRAKLFNVGVIEGIFNHEIRYHSENEMSQMCYCIILHDVDMIPVGNVKQYFI